MTIDSLSPNINIIEGVTTTISASASGGSAVTVQWYIGTSGTTTQPMAGATGTSITVHPPATTSYWLQARNQCGAIANSDTVVVTVTPCDPPAFAVQPSDGTVLMNGAATLYAVTTGTQPLLFQWYEGESGDTSVPVSNGNAATLATQPLSAPASFWVRVHNACGSADSATATIATTSSCTPPAIAVQPQNATVPEGSASGTRVRCSTSRIPSAAARLPLSLPRSARPRSSGCASPARAATSTASRQRSPRSSSGIVRRDIDD